MKNSVQETASKIEPEFQDDNNFDDIIHSTADILKLDEAEPITQDTQSEEVDEMPRTQIPQKMTRRESKTTNREESKTPDIDGPTLNDLEMESAILNGTTIGKDAELRLQRARYKALEKNISNLIEIGNDKEKQINEKNKIIKELSAKLKKSEKERDSLNKKLNGEKRDSSDLIKKCKRLEHELYSIKTDFKDYKKESKVKNDSMRNSHIRLNRALEDAEKYKNLLAKYKNENKNSSQIHNKDLVNIKNENRVLIKQKNELLSAFKKQSKLIDILKKQKIHLESAHILNFTEKQFIKTLDIGQNLTQRKK